MRLEKKLKIKNSTTRMKVRKYSKLDEIKFKGDDNFNWDVVYQARDVDIAWNTFVHCFKKILDQHAPWRVMNFSDNLPEWCTSEFLSLCKDRDCMKTKVKKTQNPIHLEQARLKRKITVNMGKELKKNYFKNAIDTCGQDSKKLWKLIKKLLGGTKGKTHIQELAGSDNAVDMANLMNNFFTDIGPNLARDMPDSLLNIDYNFTGGYDKLALNITTQEEVKKLINKVSNDKSTGINGIPIRFLKMILDTSSKILTHIINLNITSLKVPIGWKTCVLTPLFKDGDHTDPSNYRPIAILPAASKLLERTIHKQVYAFLEHNNILSKAQFGFRKNHSTTTCVLSILNDIYMNMTKGMLTGVVFLDLKKAFDSVDHNIRLKKLQMYGFDSRTTDWFSDYLGN